MKSPCSKQTGARALRSHVRNAIHPFARSTIRKPIEDSASAEPDKRSACPKCGMPPPCVSGFNSIDAPRCPNCDALFEQGKFVCYGAKVKTEYSFCAAAN